MTLYGLLQVKKTIFGNLVVDESAPTTLRQVKPGSRVRVTGFSQGLNPERKLHLQAYGLIPGRSVQVCQHSPVTVIRVEQTEIAIESDMAKEIFVNTGEGSAIS